MGQIQSGPPEMVRRFSFSASGTDGLWQPDGEEGVTWCSRHSGTHAPGCDTLHKQESIGGTACATGVGFVALDWIPSGEGWSLVAGSVVE